MSLRGGDTLSSGQSITRFSFTSFFFFCAGFLMAVDVVFLTTLALMSWARLTGGGGEDFSCCCWNLTKISPMNALISFLMGSKDVPVCASSERRILFADTVARSASFRIANCNTCSCLAGCFQPHLLQMLCLPSILVRYCSHMMSRGKFKLQ